MKPVKRDRIRAVAPFVSWPIWLAINLQLKTGMRSGELLAMRKDDLVEEDGVLVYRPDEHKSQHVGKDRVVAIGPKGRLIIAEAVFHADESDWLFPAARDSSRLMTREVCRRANKCSCVQFSVEPWHPHQLRHNHGTEVRSRFEIAAARQQLGVASMDVAAIYAERDRQRAAAIATLIGQQENFGNPWTCNTPTRISVVTSPPDPTQDPAPNGLQTCAIGARTRRHARLLACRDDAG